MRKALLIFVLLGSTAAFGQFNIGVQGAYQIINAVSTLGREAVNAVEYKKSKKERQAHEAEYMTAIQSGDSLFLLGKYTEATTQYNRALQFRQDEYAREQIARCNTESARITIQKYEALLDTADAKYTQLNYSAAIHYYQAALEIRNEEYPRAKIDLAQTKMESWKTVHFSRLLISDSSINDRSSQAYSVDSYSNFIPQGKYPVINQFYMDGIAIPDSTHLIIYSEPNFKGKILLDVSGPAIVNNSSKKNDQISQEMQSKVFKGTLQQIFPQSVRSWSSSDMHEWAKGSMEIRREVGE
jgi:tetratricopeptide (TPR) repeat protein